MDDDDPRAARIAFIRGVRTALRRTWPILSGLVMTMACLGLVIGRLEGWGAGKGLYFAFVTGLTIGYGDLAPSMGLTRFLAIATGFIGIMLTGLVAAIAVAAFQSTAARSDRPPP